MDQTQITRYVSSFEPLFYVPAFSQKDIHYMYIGPSTKGPPLRNCNFTTWNTLLLSQSQPPLHKRDRHKAKTQSSLHKRDRYKAKQQSPLHKRDKAQSQSKKKITILVITIDHKQQLVITIDHKQFISQKQDPIYRIRYDSSSLRK